MICLVDGLNILKKNCEMTMEILDTVAHLFSSDLEAGPVNGRNSAIERFLANGGDERLTQLQAHPNMEVYLK